MAVGGATVVDDEGIRGQFDREKLAGLRPAFRPTARSQRATPPSCPMRGRPGWSRRPGGRAPPAWSRWRGSWTAPWWRDGIRRPPQARDRGRVVLERQGIAPRVVDRWEINEAFASVVLASMADLDIDHDRVPTSRRAARRHRRSAQRPITAGMHGGGRGRTPSREVVDAPGGGTAAGPRVRQVARVSTRGAGPGGRRPPANAIVRLALAGGATSGRARAGPWRRLRRGRVCGSATSDPLGPGRGSGCAARATADPLEPGRRSGCAARSTGDPRGHGRGRGVRHAQRPTRGGTAGGRGVRHASTSDPPGSRAGGRGVRHAQRADGVGGPAARGVGRLRTPVGGARAGASSSWPSARAAWAESRAVGSTHGPRAEPHGHGNRGADRLDAASTSPHLGVSRRRSRHA